MNIELILDDTLQEEGQSIPAVGLKSEKGNVITDAVGESPETHKTPALDSKEPASSASLYVTY